MERKLVKEVLKIEGMTCISCEMRIEKRLKKMAGVTEAKVSYQSSIAKVTFDPQITSLQKIIEAIEKLDYKVITDKKQAFNKDVKKIGDKNSITQLIGIGIILFAAYLIIKNTVGFNFIPNISQNMGYGILFVVGLITSLHCIAMCGGINLSQCVSYKFNEKDTSKWSKLKPSLMYNMGRVLSYTIVGGIVGALGSVISFSGTAKGIVAILSGIFMVIMGLNMLNIFPGLRKFVPHMPKIFGKKINSSKGKHGPFFVGLLNGLMPCGPLQAMQIYALGTGNLFAGAASMFIFSLGTVPLMFGFGAISSFLSSKFTHRMMKVSAALVMVLGIIMLNRGFALSGISFASGLPSTPSSSNTAKVDGQVQTITTTLQSGGYTPITVKKGIPVKWIIKADASAINGCNKTITIPEYNITKTLQPGDNEIDFTPQKVGTIPYTCWMGMISSKITVVSDLSAAPVPDTQSATNSSSGVTSGGGCCGATPAKFAGGNIPTDQIGIAKISGKEQDVTVTVDNQGYTPAVVVLQKGMPAKIKFKTSQLSSCNGTVVFPEYNGQLNLSTQSETPLITPQADFTFQCGMGMLHGYVKVVDDINKVDLNAIKQEVQNYKPVGGATGGGAGGCCG